MAICVTVAALRQCAHCELDIDLGQSPEDATRVRVFVLSNGRLLHEACVDQIRRERSDVRERMFEIDRSRSALGDYFARWEDKAKRLIARDDKLDYEAYGDAMFKFYPGYAPLFSHFLLQLPLVLGQPRPQWTEVPFAYARARIKAEDLLTGRLFMRVALRTPSRRDQLLEWYGAVAKEVARHSRWSRSMRVFAGGPDPARPDLLLMYSFAYERAPGFYPDPDGSTRAGVVAACQGSEGKWGQIVRWLRAGASVGGDQDDDEGGDGPRLLPDWLGHDYASQIIDTVHVSDENDKRLVAVGLFPTSDPHIRDAWVIGLDAKQAIDTVYHMPLNKAARDVLPAYLPTTVKQKYLPALVAATSQAQQWAVYQPVPLANR